MSVIQAIKKFENILPIIARTMPDDVYEAAESCKDSDSRNIYGYFDKKKLVGFCGYFYDEGKYWISWTAVSPEYQRQGIGQTLLNRVFKQLKKLKAKCVYVETYEHPDFFNAVKFYWKNDFRLCGFLNDHLRDGSTVLYLKKEIE